MKSIRLDITDDINKSIDTLKNYLKSHEIKPYE